MVRRVQLHDFNLAEKPWIRLHVVNRPSPLVECNKLPSPFMVEWLRPKMASGSCCFFKAASKIATAGFQDRIGFEARKFSADSRTKAQLCISFQSFNENKDLETVVNSIVLSKPLLTSSGSAPRSGCFKSIRLPRKRTLYTVLRSPHVDKKSREQFEMKINKQTFIVETETPYIRSQLLRVLFQETPGVQCQVVVHYKTRIQLLNS